MPPAYEFTAAFECGSLPVVDSASLIGMVNLRGGDMAIIRVMNFYAGHRPSDFKLDPSLPDIHVWIFELWRHSGEHTGRNTVLSREEISRSDRFRFSKDRDEFLIVHEAIRHVLSLYVNCSARDIRFTYGKYGKPRLEDRISDLRFNHSRSNGVAVCAVARGSEVGIDTEYVRSIKGFDTIITDHFTEKEATAIRDLPKWQQLEAFYTYWTRKEAFCKAVGRGLFLPLDSFEVAASLAGATRLVMVRDMPQEIDSWKLVDFTVHHKWRTTLCFQVGPSSMLAR